MFVAVASKRFFSPTVAFVALLWGQEIRAEKPRPSPHFQGTTIPEPPHQHDAWAPPPSRVPEVFITATATLFDQGLADPRGCEYREIEVGVGSVWSGDGGIVKTHGWVLPAEPAEKQRFAVCWNGLVYPLVSLGDKTDLKADILSVVKADEEWRDKWAKKNPDFPFHRFDTLSEGDWVSPPHVLPLRACLLLRLGEEELARMAWTAWTAGMPENVNNNAIHLKDPYLKLATDWAWALFDRAVCAHMRGDDHLALLSARALVPIQKAIEAESEKRGFEHPQDRDNQAVRQRRPYLGFLEPLPALLADQERRAKQPKREEVLKAGLENYPGKAKRIAALLQDLEELAARQWGQPGGVQFNFEPLVMALINEGEEAVEPLIDCVQKDTRLTRSVSFGRDFFMRRSIHGVNEAAYEALSEILHTSQFGTGSSRYELREGGDEGRRRVAATIRAYWEKFKGVAMEERWYRILADDNAPAEQWLEAARYVVQRVSVTEESDEIAGGPTSPPLRITAEAPKLRGEPLRSRYGPAIAELMAKCVEILNDSGRPGSSRTFALHDACRMALCLAKWYPESAIPTLRTQIKRCQKEMVDGFQPGSWTSQILGSYIAELTLARARGKDLKALDEYAAWLRNLTTEQVEDYVTEVFGPIWCHPDHPAIAEVAEWLFNDPRSPWVPLVQKRHKDLGHKLVGLLETPLVGVPGFRKYLIRELGNKAEAGTVKLRESGSMDVHLEAGWAISRGSSYEADPLAPKPGTESTFRMCDYFAWKLSEVEGTPRCELYWPEPQRDAAAAACVAFLKQYGERFKHSATELAFGSRRSDEKARMSFPLVDHPATADEVKRGMAVFSLAGEGDSRLWKLPSRPMRAKWVTLKDYPQVSDNYDETGKRNVFIEYEQNGLVWQAEEISIHGKWQRYYGFVGRYCVAKVPGSDIEFPAGDPWAELSRRLDCLIRGPEPLRRQDESAPHSIELGKPLVVTVWLRNRSGLDQTVPAPLYRKDPPQAPALHTGVDVHLYRTIEDATAAQQTPGEPSEPAWQELQPKARSRLQVDQAARTLRPAEEIVGFQLDLKDWFDITQPGVYKLQFTFSRGGAGFADGKSNPVLFSLK